jgi:hypothetical protein
MGFDVLCVFSGLCSWNCWRAYDLRPATLGERKLEEGSLQGVKYRFKKCRERLRGKNACKVLRDDQRKNRGCPAAGV